MKPFRGTDAKRFAALSEPGLSRNTRAALEFLQRNGAKPGMACLGIGAGEGELEHVLARDLDAGVGYIDPSKNLADVFLKKMEESGLEAKVLDFIVEPAEAARPRHVYDCASAVHSWYYIGYSKAVLDAMLARLKPGGGLHILVHAEDSVVRRLAPQEVYAERLAEWARAQGCAVAAEPLVDAVPASRFLAPDGSFNEFGRQWLSYLLRKDAGAIGEDEWTRCARILGGGKDDVAFAYGWVSVKSR